MNEGGGSGLMNEWLARFRLQRWVSTFLISVVSTPKLEQHKYPNVLHSCSPFSPLPSFSIMVVLQGLDADDHFGTRHWAKIETSSAGLQGAVNLPAGRLRAQPQPTIMTRNLQLK